MSVTRQQNAQKKWCPDYDQIMVGLEERLKEWVLVETEIRLKCFLESQYALFVVHHCLLDHIFTK